jgi:hypothetical protein
MKCIDAIKFHRKSGGAQPRDLQFHGPVLEMFFSKGGTCSSLTEQSQPNHAPFPL